MNGSILGIVYYIKQLVHALSEIHKIIISTEASPFDCKVESYDKIKKIVLNTIYEKEV